MSAKGGGVGINGDDKRNAGREEKKMTTRERVAETERREENKANVQEDDDDDDDVVVIDQIPSRYSSLASVHQLTSADTAPTTAASAPPAVPKMDPPPHSQHQHSQQSWFSPNIFLGPGTSEGGDNPTDQSQSSASAGAQRLITELRQRYQPWTVFFQCAKFACPPSLIGIGPRIKRNLATFATNYLCLFVLLLLYCVLTSLLMLLTLVVLGGLLYSVYQVTRKGPVLIGSYEVPPSLLYTLALMLSIPFFWLADAGSVMYWVLGSGLFLMLAHSTFYASEEVPGSEFEVVVNA